MRLKKIAGAALGALLLLAGTATRAQTFNFTMAVIPAPSDPYSVLSAKVPERIAKATNGRVKITVNDSLIPGTQIVSAVRDGRVEMSAALHSYLTAEEPRFGIFNLPGLIEGMDDYVKVRNAFWFEDTHKIWKERYKSVVLAEGAWCTQGLFSKLVADTAPRDLLGTGFGVFNLVSGFSMILASGIAGVLWTASGAEATFLAGAAFAAVAAVGVFARARGRQP